MLEQGVHIVHITLACLIAYPACASSKELSLLGFLPMTGGWSGGAPCLQALRMALDDVNSDVNILSDYNLTLLSTDTKCSPGIALYRMFRVLFKKPPFVMVIGGGCSVVSEATAQVTYLWNLTQVTYGSASPVLSDRRRFPRFFRLTLPDQKLSPARIDLMREFNWGKAATINQALEFFSAVTDDFVKTVLGTNITIISQEIFTEDPMTRVQNLKNRDARIIMTALYEDKARALLCAAYKVGLYGPKIIWVFMSWYSKTFWRVNLKEVDCTEEEMIQAAEGSFLTGQVFQNPTEERGVANITASEFETRYYNHPTYNVDTNDYDFIVHQCYDTMWVAALALDCAHRRLQFLGYPKSLDMFTYDDSDINDIIAECMANTSLTGVSGHIAFTDGDPDRMIKVERIQDGVRIPVGFYRQDKHPRYFEWIKDAIKWKGNTIPRDSTSITYKEVEIPHVLYVTMTSLSVFGICLVLIFFVFNVVYRNNGYT